MDIFGKSALEFKKANNVLSYEHLKINLSSLLSDLTIVFIGPSESGKSSLISSFVQSIPESQIKKTTHNHHTIECLRSNRLFSNTINYLYIELIAYNLHIYELSSVERAPTLLDLIITRDNIDSILVYIVLDLSKPKYICNHVVFWLRAIKQRVTTLFRELALIYKTEVGKIQQNRRSIGTPPLPDDTSNNVIPFESILTTTSCNSPNFSYPSDWTSTPTHTLPSSFAKTPDLSSKTQHPTNLTTHSPSSISFPSSSYVTPLKHKKDISHTPNSSQTDQPLHSHSRSVSISSTSSPPFPISTQSVSFIPTPLPSSFPNHTTSPSPTPSSFPSSSPSQLPSVSSQLDVPPDPLPKVLMQLTSTQFRKNPEKSLFKPIPLPICVVPNKYDVFIEKYGYSHDSKSLFIKIHTVISCFLRFFALKYGASILYSAKNLKNTLQIMYFRHNEFASRSFYGSIDNESSRSGSVGGGVRSDTGHRVGVAPSSMPTQLDPLRPITISFGNDTYASLNNTMSQNGVGVGVGDDSGRIADILKHSTSVDYAMKSYEHLIEQKLSDFTVNNEQNSSDIFNSSEEKNDRDDVDIEILLDNLSSGNNGPMNTEIDTINSTNKNTLHSEDIETYKQHLKSVQHLSIDPKRWNLIINRNYSKSVDSPLEVTLEHEKIENSSFSKPILVSEASIDHAIRHEGYISIQKTKMESFRLEKLRNQPINPF